MSGLMPSHAKRHAPRRLLLKLVALLAVCYALAPLWRAPSISAMVCGLLGLLAVWYFYRRAVRFPLTKSRRWQESYLKSGRPDHLYEMVLAAMEEASSIARHDPKALRWFGEGATLTVGPYTLRDPLVYALAGDGFVDEVSCIDPGLPVGKPVKQPPGSLGYFPDYAGLSPAQRANYLRWLAGGRAGPPMEIGYASLFFYGLERRLLLEGKDRAIIINEAMRLLETNRSSQPFELCLSRFLSYNLARAGLDTITDASFAALFERAGAGVWRDEQHLAVGLAWLFHQRRPLPAAWALELVRRDPRTPRSVVLERLPEQFNALFIKRYREQHGQGLLLRAARRDCAIGYSPASPSLSEGFTTVPSFPAVRIPNVLGAPDQFASLGAIWARCLEELKPLSRALARGVGINSRAAYDALPEDLRADTEHPDRPAWDRLAAEKAEADGTVIVAVGELAGIHGIAERPRLTLKQSRLIAQAAYTFGFVIEPDAQRTSRSYRWGELVALFRPEGSPSAPADSRYPGAALLLELGMFVAAADGRIGEDEVDQITRFLESKFRLDPPDVRRLEALKRVFLKQAPSIGGIGKRLKAILSAEQLESAGEFLIGVAAAGGTIGKKEVTALRAAYRALEIDAGRLENLLAEYRRLEKEPVEVQREVASGDDGEALPRRPPTGAGPRFTLRLDAALVERLMQETRQVAVLLDEAMPEDPSDPSAEESPPEEVPQAAQSSRSETVTATAAEARFDGLVSRYRAVLAALCTRRSWRRAEFETLVRDHSLMPAGTLDVINEWSQDRFAEPILEEDGDDLIVHAGLVAEEG
jgi:uncharacterized tellurite resistance protein B-like protein